MADLQTIQTQRDDAVLRVMLNRPELRNAINPQMIAELTSLFREIAEDQDLRVVVLGGLGTYFCAGADLNWMRDMADYSAAENLADALKLAQLFDAVDCAPQAVISRVQGGAYGGGLGLMCCSDYVIAGRECSFAFSEVRLGISPATIGPFVAARIGHAAARDVLLSGRRFNAEHARSIQLVNQVVEASDLDDAVEMSCHNYLQAAPLALAQTKQIMRELADDPLLGATAAAREHRRQRTSELIARLRTSVEGQAGLSAYLNREKPPWQQG